MTLAEFKNLFGISTLSFKETETGTPMAWPKREIKVFLAKEFDSNKPAFVNVDDRWGDATDGSKSYWVTNKSGDPLETFGQKKTVATL